jgi:Na+-transporting NADH:ubiquinone oxidoreductase subunit F
MDTFILGVTLFTLIVLALVTIIIFARSKFVSSGEVSITINGEKKNKSSYRWETTSVISR